MLYGNAYALGNRWVELKVAFDNKLYCVLMWVWCGDFRRVWHLLDLDFSIGLYSSILL